MASPKVEILLSIAKAQAVQAASQASTEIADKMNKGLGAIRFNATLELFNKLVNAAKKFYNFIEEHNQHVREMGEAMAKSMDNLGASIGKNAGRNKEFIAAMQGVQRLIDQMGVSAAGGAGLIGMFVSAASAAVSVTAKLATGILGSIDDMMVMVGLAQKVQTTLSGAAFNPEDSAVRNKKLSPFKQKRFVPREEDVKADEEKRVKDIAAAREKRLREAQERDRIEIDARNSLLNAELEELRAADAQKELLAEREADRQQAQLQVKFDAIAAIGKAGEDEILITQARDEYLAQLADNRLLSDEERYKREQSIRESAGKALEALENKKMAEDRKRTAEKKMLLQQYGNVIASGMAGAIAEAAKGQESLGDILKKALGGMMTSMGTMLIQMGTAAVLAGTLGTLVPIFAPMTGGPAGVTAGLAAIAGGALMVAAGSAMGGSAGDGAGGGRGPGAVTSASGPGTGVFGGRLLSISSNTDASLSRSSREFERDTAQDRSVVVNINMGTGIVHGTPERLSREIGLATQGALGRLG